MFVKKSQAEINAMTDQEAEVYATAKANHEAELQKEAIKSAVSAAEKGLEEKMQEIIKASKAEKEATEEILKAQGIELAKLKNPAYSLTAAAELAKTELKEIHKMTNEGTVGHKQVLKAFSLDNTMSVGSFPSETTGTISGAIGTIANFFSTVLPSIFRKPVPKSNIADYCDVMPVTNMQMVSISQTETINLAVTPEVTIKPISKAVWTNSMVTALPIATLFKSSDQIRRFFESFVKAFYETILSYFDQKIPAEIIAKVNALATAFTPLPSQVYASGVVVSNFDVIIQVIAGLVNNGYVPNCVRLSTFAYAKLLTQKGATGDGQYQLNNGGSINLINGGIVFGKVIIPIETDPTLAVDQFQIGDFTVVKVGLDADFSYVETLTEDDMTNNTKSHRIEKYMAVDIPTALRSGIVKDTFTNSRTLLTA